MKVVNKFLLGFVSMFMLLLISILILWKSNFKMMNNDYILIGSFKNVSGLLKGAEVRYRGYKIGSVNDIIPSPQDIRVHFSVQKGVLIPIGSNLTIKFDGIVGETYIFINPNETSTKFYSHKDTVLGENYSDLSKFLDVGSKGLIQAETILIKLNSLLTTTDFAVKLKNIIENLEYITNQSKQLTNSVSKGNIIKNAEDSFTYLSSITKQLDEVVASLDTQDINTLINDLSIIVNNTKSILNDENSYRITNIIKNSDKISTSLEQILNENSNRDPFGFKILQNIKKLKLSSKTSIYQAHTEYFSYYHADLKLTGKKSFYKIGFGDRLGSSKVLHFQQGLYINKNLTTRIGLFYQKPSIGLGFNKNKFEFNVNVYDMNDLKYNITGGYKMHNYTFMLGAESNPINSVETNFLSGLSLRF